MGNRDRVVAAALALMNEYGAEAIGTNRIAAEADVSPGNLYYHFANREEIVRVLFDALEAEFRDVLQRDVESPLSPGRVAAFYVRSFDLAWRYRFFFGGTLGLLRRDAELARRYRALQAWAIDELEGIAGRIAADGRLAHPRRQAGLRSVALSTWLIWSNWIRYLQISGHETIARADMAAGVGQLFDVLSPYLEDRFEREVRRLVEAAWPPEGPDGAV